MCNLFPTPFIRMKQFFLRAFPAIFIAGALFGAGVSQIGASFKGSAVFRDVPSSHYADDAIGEMVQLGIIKGLNSETFGPDQPLTRGQAALLFKRLRDEIKGITSSSSVSSSSSSSSVSSSVSSSSSNSSVSSSLAYNAGGYVHFDSNGYNIDKNASIGQVTVIVVRTGGNQGAGSVDYSFSGGTAVAGKNYQPLSGTLNFLNKEPSKKIPVQILNDTTTTGTKTVSLVLRNPKGAIAVSTPSSVTLNINDPNASSSSSVASSASSSSAASTTIGLSATAYGVAENGGNMTVTVVRSGITTTSVGVNYTTTNGSAFSGSDYTATSGTFTFASGETTKTFSVPVANNTSIEGNRSFSINLSVPTGGATLAVSSALVTINDDEGIALGSGSLKFSATTYAAIMSQGSVTITVNHVLGVKPVSVNYATSGGSGTSGIDYTSVSGTLSFAANETSKTFTIPLLTNTNSSGGKTINLVLSNPTGGSTLVDPSMATVSISL